MSNQARLFFGEREALQLLWESLPAQDRERATSLYASLIARGTRRVAPTGSPAPTKTSQALLANIGRDASVQSRPSGIARAPRPGQKEEVIEHIAHE